MKIIKLPGTSLEISNICLGGGSFGNKLTKSEVFTLLDFFTDSGGNFIDTANVYCKWVKGLNNCSEEIIGEWMKIRNACGKVVVATKGGHYDFYNPQIPRVNKPDVRKDLEESLRTLGLDQIDLYYLHRDDEAKPIEEIIDMMEGFVKEGLIRYYGASNYRPARLKAAVLYAKSEGFQGFRAVSNQWSMASVNPNSNPNPDPSLVAMTDELYQWHTETQIPAIPYSSSAHGFFEKLYQLHPKVENGILLTPFEELNLPEDMKRAYLNEHNLRSYEKLLDIKNEYQCSLHTLSIAYFFNHPFCVIPVSSVGNIGQLKDFIRASEIDFLYRD